MIWLKLIFSVKSLTKLTHLASLSCEVHYLDDPLLPDVGGPVGDPADLPVEPHLVRLEDTGGVADLQHEAVTWCEDIIITFLE